MTDKKTEKKIKPLLFDEVEYPEVPKELYKLYELQKPKGYKTKTVTQNLDDFLKVEEMLVIQANKISELYTNKEITEDFKSEALSVMKVRFDELFEEMIFRISK